MNTNHRRIRVNGVELNVLAGGEGPAVLLVHGVPDDHTVWRHRIPALAALFIAFWMWHTAGDAGKLTPVELDAYLRRIGAGLPGIPVVGGTVLPDLRWVLCGASLIVFFAVGWWRAKRSVRSTPRS